MIEDPNVKIVILKTGQYLITRIQELRESDKPLCFLITAPLILSYQQSNEDPEKMEMVFTLWCPFSQSIQYRVPFEHVVSVGEPKEDVYIRYMEIAGPLLDRIDQIDEDEQEITEETNE